MISKTAVRIVMFSGVALLMAATPPALAGTIAGSAHDFTISGAYKEPGGRICVACHTPHVSSAVTGPQALQSAAPLWNHKTLDTTYALYGVGSTTMKASVGQPGPLSKLCLSCHDGTLAIDAFGGATGSVMMTNSDPTRSMNVGTDLSNDHPIGISQAQAINNGNTTLAAPSASVTIGDTPKKTGTIDSLMLYGGQLECSSCHDVHNTFAVGAKGTGMVKMGTSGSGLCMACHLK